MENMVMRAASNICAKADPNYVGWPQEAARAALEAMREPTEAMIKAGSNQLAMNVREDWSDEAKRCWSAMLTAALNEQPEKEG